MEIKSVLNNIIQEIYGTKDINVAKSKFITLMENCNIKESDKEKMISEVEKMETLHKIQFYATNCMFKYEGLGID